jgi:hypothetical protein
MRPKPLIAAALAAFFAVSCAQLRTDRDKVSSRPSSTAQASDVGAQTRGETPLAAGGAGGNGGSTRD